MRRVLAAERPAAVGAAAAVAVDDDLAAGQAGVAVRAADDEFAGRVDVEDDVVVPQLLGDRRADHLLDDLALGLFGDDVLLLVEHASSCCVETTTV